MTNKLAGTALFAVLLMLAPLAAAEADTPTSDDTRPDDAAWVEDCPPDMMCAAASNERLHDDATEECTDCGSPAYDNTTWGSDCPVGMYCMYDGSTDGCDGDACSHAPVTEDDRRRAEEASGGTVVVPIGAMVVAAGLAYVSGRRD